ncbi:hypothetical protein BPS26883_04673 [Burkholderia pseudomultivorans]|uniref:Uncharacterized protein n=1 Tax=Burkholderia pseudomultivorans TaxID=1207504 RepID=A0A6P2NPL3_9BURK|nr:hypothetical protein [Burkholderia pseudomultivorans]VWB96627.1 hypothetical protein BPS26883_04673 [Burkholderia pseudomultivorans]
MSERATQLYGGTLAPVVPDGEVAAFLSGFLAADNRFQQDWLPRYRETTEAIATALSSGAHEDLFDILWMTRDNSIADAGRGMLQSGDPDRLREELVQIISDVQKDGSPENFDHIVKRAERWRAGGRIAKVPRLLIRRVFAGIHPNHYHTTVDAPSHDAALQWFATHTKFSVPESESWAVRARSLVDHLDRLEVFRDDVLVRNMFPWFVADQVQSRSTSTRAPQYRKRSTIAFQHVPETQRKILLRHNEIQAALYKLLVKEHGQDRVWMERGTGTGGYADAVVYPVGGGCYLYETKIASSAAEVVRQAMGQLLEYGYRRGGLDPVKLFAVGEPDLDSATREFIERLQAQFKLNIEYLQVTLPDGATS